MHLSGEHVHAYRTRGFLHVPQVLNEKDCGVLKETLLRLAEEGLRQKLREQPAASSVKIDREKIADIPRAIDRGMFQDIAHRHPDFMALAKDKRLIDCVAPILGEDLVMYRSLCVFKPKNYPNPVGWHRDMPYWRGSEEKLSAWLALDDADEENGALHFIPGTHTLEVDGAEMEKRDEVFSLVLPDKYIDQAKDTMERAKSGDVVLFHSRVFHSSGPNRTGRDRYSLVFTYQPAWDQSHHRAGAPELVSGRMSERRSR